MIGYTLPEIRRLLISLIQALRYPTPNESGPGPPGADDASTRPGSATTGDAAMRSPKCRCSIKGWQHRGQAPRMRASTICSWCRTW